MLEFGAALALLCCFFPCVGFLFWTCSNGTHKQTGVAEHDIKPGYLSLTHDSADKEALSAIHPADRRVHITPALSAFLYMNKTWSQFKRPHRGDAAQVHG